MSYSSGVRGFGIAVAAAFIVATASCTIEPVGNGGDSGAEEPDFRTQVSDILDAQAAAWNAGDLDGFMSSYDLSPETSYIGASGLITGFEGIRERYAPLFEPGAERDSLHFVNLSVRELDPRFGVATARYVLTAGGRITSTGPFTLVLMRVEGTWVIVHDQSAADPPGAAADSS
ncbi:MAG: nuclear transport factor 2 family protein [Gemmatimonadota bacterium]|nr:nuclear transport factor 2 family protein [Gemmatimonadota bacterium]